MKDKGDREITLRDPPSEKFVEDPGLDLVDWKDRSARSLTFYPGTGTVIVGRGRCFKIYPGISIHNWNRLLDICVKEPEIEFNFPDEKEWTEYLHGRRH